MSPRCPRCKSVMVKKTGRFGEFFGCSRYPRCKGIRNRDGGLPESECNRLGYSKYDFLDQDEDDPTYDTVEYDGIYRIQDFGMDMMDWGDRD